MDPQSRLLLECSWHALENAGYDPARYERAVGVFAASSMNTYLLRNIYPRLNPEEFILSRTNLPHVMANGQDFLATRVSYKLNLRGPSIDVQTACSSALVAIHMARQSLLNGECDMAIAGGVSIYLPQDAGYLYEPGLILSRDGHCRVFDRTATGTIFGRGVGIVVLKPLAEALADGDRVLAVIKGSAINNDGADKVGFTAPSVNGQAAVVAEALANAGVEAETVSYVEAHGTGTTQGDPIEVAALTQAFRLYDRRGWFLPHRISQIEHRPSRRRIGGGELHQSRADARAWQDPAEPPFRNPQPRDRVRGYAVRGQHGAPRSARPARDAARRSQFVRDGGTNAHMVLEQPPVVGHAAPSPRDVEARSEVLTLSARDGAALQHLASDYARLLDDGASIADVCFTANTGRARFSHRCAAVAATAAELARQLRAVKSESSERAARPWSGRVDARNRRRVSFLFTGQGLQDVGMGRELYRCESVFREHLDRCAAILQPSLKTSLTSLLFEARDTPSGLEQTGNTQPALFALEYSLARQWMAWDSNPQLLIGHSLGEYVAACIAGVWSLEDALALVAKRAALMQALPSGGAMAAVFGLSNACWKFCASSAETVTRTSRAPSGSE